MDRRQAIKSIAIASTATIFLTGCADKNVVEFLQGETLLLNDKHLEYLGKISETFLPVSGISEKIGDPVPFIMTMINDTHSPEDILIFATGFEDYKILMQESRLKINSAEPEATIRTVTEVLEAGEPKEELVHFINTVKGLSTYHFTSSEYYMVEIGEYKMIPDKYDPCMDV